jgi:hypothetical protein
MFAFAANASGYWICKPTAGGTCGEKSNTMTEQEVKSVVSSLPNLTTEQREIVVEISVAALKKQPGLGVNVESIANYVRSQANHIGNQERPYPTGNTFKANGGKI